VERILDGNVVLTDIPFFDRLKFSMVPLDDIEHTWVMSAKQSSGSASGIFEAIAIQETTVTLGID
jgi:hypothetical protein